MQDVIRFEKFKEYHFVVLKVANNTTYRVIEDSVDEIQKLICVDVLVVTDSGTCKSYPYDK